MKWTGPAAWGKKEARAGDRLPYATHLDDRTLQLRDGALMQAVAVAGMPFETETADQLNHMLGVREVLLRSALDGRFILYHHLIRRQVGVALAARFDSPFAAELDRHWRERLAAKQLFVNEQFLTLVRRPARGKAGWPERIARMLGRKLDGDSDEIDPALIRELDAATQALLSSLEPYGARQLGCYPSREGQCSEPLELLSALYNGEMRPVLRPADGFVCVVGGQWTTYRVMAGDVVDAAVVELTALNPERLVPPSVTADIPVVGASGFREMWEAREQVAAEADVEVAVVEHLLRRHGDRTAGVLDLIAQDPTLGQKLHPDAPYLRAEIVTAAADEGALTLEDTLVRRTRLAMEVRDGGHAIAEAAAGLMSPWMGWSASDVDDAVADFRDSRRAQLPQLS